ncbi:MAG TPA: ice-binding family protein [Patescibacteria group bacterium]|nr:ice-binding family protein [Patescibacteria group bacterium]
MNKKRLPALLTSITLVIFTPIFLFTLASSVNAATAPNLGTAGSYSAFGKAGVTNNSAVGTTHLWGNVGADLLSSITNLVASQVDGAIIAPAAGVESAILSAYGALASQPLTTITPINLAVNNTVGPGVYDVQASTLAGTTLTLSGSGVYIFRSSSSISTSGSAMVKLTNGATACNVFWQIPAAMTIGTGTQMVGTIIADTQLISLATGATLQGRALSRIAQVTLDNSQITTPGSCTTTAPTAPTPSPAPTAPSAPTAPTAPTAPSAPTPPPGFSVCPTPTNFCTSLRCR